MRPKSAIKAAVQGGDLPENLVPELATLVSAPPSTPDDWIFEIKYGYRMLARVEGDDVRLISRNAKDWTPKLLPLQAELRRMKLPTGWYDGEIVVHDRAGKPDFGLLQNSFDRNKTNDIDYFIFDAPFTGGVDMRDRPLTERRATLAALLNKRPSEKVRFSEALDAPPDRMIAAACEMGLEGLIGKRKDSLYVPRRSNDWIKLKCGKRQEFVIGGFTDPGGARIGLGALLLGTYDDKKKLIYSRSVGTGFDDKTLRNIYKQIQPIEVAACPFVHHKELPKMARWVAPELVAEVAFAEWTHTGLIRHATFRGMRTDKPPTNIRREDQSRLTAESPLATRVPAVLAKPNIKITNGARIVDTRSGITKQRLVEYYSSVSELMLLHLAQRPVSMVRAPAGIERELFFQKHATTAKLTGVRRFPVSAIPATRRCWRWQTPRRSCPPRSGT